MSEFNFTPQQESAIKSADEARTAYLDANLDSAAGLHTLPLLKARSQMNAAFPELSAAADIWNSAGADEDIYPDDPRFTFPESGEQQAFYVLTGLTSLINAATISAVIRADYQLGDDLSDLKSYCRTWDGDHGIWFN